MDGEALVVVGLLVLVGSVSAFSCATSGEFAPNTFEDPAEVLELHVRRRDVADVAAGTSEAAHGAGGVDGGAPVAETLTNRAGWGKNPIRLARPVGERDFVSTVPVELYVS